MLIVVTMVEEMEDARCVLKLWELFGGEFERCRFCLSYGGGWCHRSDGWCRASSMFWCSKRLKENGSWYGVSSRLEVLVWSNHHSNRLHNLIAHKNEKVQRNQGPTCELRDLENYSIYARSNPSISSRIPSSFEIPSKLLKDEESRSEVTLRRRGLHNSELQNSAKSNLDLW